MAFVLVPTWSCRRCRATTPDFTDPIYLPQWLQQYDPATGTMPLWGSVPE
jgi:hypothetical protein